MKTILKSNDQLRQRVAFALSEIFVISDAENFSDQQLALANYYDILIRYSFGNFRTLLTEVTLNPIMGEYLSLKGNQKPIPDENIRPDENYAREIMQLFTIGLVELNEAFASQSLACIRELNIDPSKVNVNGGAIALGHPLWCTGAKLTIQSLGDMKRLNKKYGMVTACVGGGQGIAGIIENLQ